MCFEMLQGNMGQSLCPLKTPKASCASRNSLTKQYTHITLALKAGLPMAQLKTEAAARRLRDWVSSVLH